MSAAFLHSIGPGWRAVACAPARVDPAGGGTDAPPFSIEHGGVVVNFAIARHAWACVDHLPRGHGLAAWSEDLARGFHAADHGALATAGPHEFLAAFLRRLVPAGESVLLTTESDVPPGSGLGGSGALGVAVVAALDRAFCRERSIEETARLANQVEREDLGYPGGSQDSLAAAFGSFQRIEYVQGGEVRRRRIDVPPAALHAIERRSLLVYTGAAHVSGSIHDDIRRDYGSEDSSVVRALLALRADAQALTEDLESGDVESFARTLDSACEHLYELHPSCDSEEHRRLWKSLDDVAVGRKTCGAGGGGFLLVVSRAHTRAECERRARSLGARVWPVCIDHAGVRSWNEPALGGAELEAMLARCSERLPD